MALPRPPIRECKAKPCPFLSSPGGELLGQHAVLPLPRGTSPIPHPPSPIPHPLFSLLMLKVAHPGEDHRHTAGVRGRDDFGVLDGTAWLDGAGGASVCSGDEAIREGEEGV